MPITLETERLILNPMGADDIEPHIAMMRDEDMARFLTASGVPNDYGHEWRMAASMVGHWLIMGFGFFSVREKQTGSWVGRVGPWQPGGWPGLEVGWGIKRDYWGLGYAPEAAIATMRWVFHQFPDLHRIISLIDPTNQNSQAVARKVGETRSDEIFTYAGHELKIWEARREDWINQFGA